MTVDLENEGYFTYNQEKEEANHVSLTFNASHDSGNVPSISVGNTRVYEDSNAGCQAWAYNTYYWIIVHIAPSRGMELDLATDVEGNNNVFRYLAGLGEYDQTTYTTAARDSIYTNGTQTNLRQSMTAIITDIAISNKKIEWDEAFNYLEEKQVSLMLILLKLVEYLQQNYTPRLTVSITALVLLCIMEEAL